MNLQSKLATHTLNIELKMQVGWNNGQTDRRMIQLLDAPDRFVRPGA